VAATFGGWTSASRKAMLPVFEQNEALLYYPVQYEGLEQSPYIFYSGATTNEQIVPALDYLKALAAENAGTTEVAAVKEASKGLSFDAPEGTVTIMENQHIAKTARIGRIRADGLIDQIAGSDAPIAPDPFLETLPLGPGPGRVVRMDFVLPQVFAGLGIASVLLLIALGLTFTFGQMNVINMAHGEFIMAGAYTPYLLQGVFRAGLAGLAFGVALPVAFVVSGLAGLVLERTLIRRMCGRPLDTLLVTWGSASCSSNWPGISSALPTSR
jgi:hypothetical protein